MSLKLEESYGVTYSIEPAQTTEMECLFTVT